MAQRKRKVKKPVIRKPKTYGTGGGGLSSEGTSQTSRQRSGAPKTTKSYNNLVRELRNARARIRAAENRLGDEYFGPSASEYTVENIIKRLEDGTHINRIYAEIRGLNAEGLKRISDNNTPVAVAPNGWAITRKEAANTQKAIDRANKVLQQARTKYGADAVPADYTIQDIANHITNPEGLQEYTDYLKRAYGKKSSGDLIKYPQSDEMILKGEYDFIQEIIQRENRRREENKKFQNAVFKSKGRLMTQTEFSLTPLEPSYMPTISSYRTMADRWDDARRLKKANIWVNNYITSLDTTLTNINEYNLVNGGIDMEKVRGYYNKIMEYVKRLDSAQMVERATLYSPYFSITEVNYFNADQAVTTLVFVLSAWEDFYNDYG